MVENTVKKLRKACEQIVENSIKNSVENLVKLKFIFIYMCAHTYANGILFIWIWKYESTMTISSLFLHFFSHTKASSCTISFTI